MITVNLFDDGVYYMGSVRADVARVLAYAAFSLERDCLAAGEVFLFNCTKEPDWKGAGFIFLSIETNNPVQHHIFGNYKRNIALWMRAGFPELVTVNEYEGKIDFETAKFDAIFTANMEERGLH